MKRLLISLLLIVPLFAGLIMGGPAANAAEYATLLPDSDTTVEITDGGMVAQYQFIAEHSCMYLFYSASDEDTYGELYDIDGNLLFENDDYYGLNFGIECILEAGETYVLSVCYLDTEATGSFSLIAVTNHEDDSDVIREPNCQVAGEVLHICSICAYEWTEIIPAEHFYENGVCVECGEPMFVSGECGDGLTWSYDGVTKSLTITGTGAMYDYWEEPPAWFSFGEEILSLTVDSGVTGIGENAFSGLEELQSVVIADSVITIADNAFSYCGKLTDISLPNGLQSVGAYAFAYCSHLGEITLPMSVTQIGDGAFQGCSRLLGIRVADGNQFYASDAYGVLFDASMQKLIQAPATLDGHYIIPGTVQIIGASAFGGCKSLDAVTIPASVSEIGNNAFSDCVSLSFVRIPASVTDIGESAFSNCSGLKGILFEGNVPASDGVILEDVTTIAYYPNGNATWTEDCRLALGEDITWSGVSGLCIVTQPKSEEGLLGSKIALVAGVNGQNLTYTWWCAQPGSDTFVALDNSGNTLEILLEKAAVGMRLYCVITDGSEARVQTTTVTLQTFAEIREETSINVSLESDASFKYISFTPNYSCFYTFSGLAGADVYGELYDAFYNLLATSDDATGADFRLNIQLEAGKSYIIGIRTNDNQAGNVDLSVQAKHKYITQVYAPTCLGEGYTVYTCTTCGACHTGDPVPPVGHSYTVVVIDPTCTSDGYTVYICPFCVDYYVGDQKATDGHCYSSAVTEPTCTEDGVVTYTCTCCGYGYEEKISAAGHSYEKTVTAPTCTEAGYTTYACVDCGASFVADTTASLGHSWMEPTCTTAKTCNICGETDGEPDGHNYTGVVIAPTCTEGGYTIYMCTKCSTYYIGDSRPAMNHSYEAKVIAPTCTEAGYTTYTCACGDSYTESGEAALGHGNLSYSFANNTHTFTCTICNQVAFTKASTDGKQLKFRTAAPVLSDSINVLFGIEVPEGFEKPYVVFTFNGKEIRVDDYFINDKGRNTYEFPGVNPQTIGDNIGATVYAYVDGSLVSLTYGKDYSVRTYCVSQLAKPAVTGAIRTLLCDLLIYGEKTQIYQRYKLDNLITTGLELTGSTFTNLDASYDKQQMVGTASTAAAFKAVTLQLSGKMTIVVSVLADDISKYTVTVERAGTVYTYNPEDLVYNESNGRYQLFFDELKANSFNEAITFSILENGHVVGQQLVYSVNSYIQKNQSKTSGDLLELLKAIYNYGAAAAALDK
jgi:hypothetical protein